MSRVAQLPRVAGFVLARPLGERPEHEAVVGRDRRLTYRQLDALADTAAGALYSVGVRLGDRVAVSLPNTTDIVVLFHAVMRLGAVWVGVNTTLAPPEKAYIIDDSGARLFLAPREILETVDISRCPGRPACLTPQELQADVPSDDGGRDYLRPLDLFDEPAGIAYTSGTTGRPKGVVHSHRNLVLPGAVLVADRGYGPSLRRGDCAALTILNLQVTSTLLVAQAGGTQIVMDRVDPEGIAEWIRTEQVTSWFGVPTMLHGLATTELVPPSDLASLEDVWTGGADIAEPTRVAFETKFERPVHETYGLTEVPTVVSIEAKGAPHRPGSSGRVLPHLSVEIGYDGRAGSAPAGEILVGPRRDGEWADTYRLMLGYHRKPAETAAAVGDGRLHSGDVGVVDDGELFVRGRRTSLILRGGANVYPAEVERVLLACPGVVGAAVIGVPDERLGQRVAAAVELGPGASLDQAALESHCRAALARYKVPERWSLGPLPRNAMGKVIHPEVVTRFASQP
jgi:long-chain acyl-CoA synthetase